MWAPEIYENVQITGATRKADSQEGKAKCSEEKETTKSVPDHTADGVANEIKVLRCTKDRNSAAGCHDDNDDDDDGDGDWSDFEDEEEEVSADGLSGSDGKTDDDDENDDDDDESHDDEPVSYGAEEQVEEEYVNTASILGSLTAALMNKQRSLELPRASAMPIASAVSKRSGDVQTRDSNVPKLLGQTCGNTTRASSKKEKRHAPDPPANKRKTELKQEGSGENLSDGNKQSQKSSGNSETMSPSVESNFLDKPSCEDKGESCSAAVEGSCLESDLMDTKKSNRLSTLSMAENLVYGVIGFSKRDSPQKQTDEKGESFVKNGQGGQENKGYVPDDNAHRCLTIRDSYGTVQVDAKDGEEPEKDDVYEIVEFPSKTDRDTGLKRIQIKILEKENRKANHIDNEVYSLEKEADKGKMDQTQPVKTDKMDQTQPVKTDKTAAAMSPTEIDLTGSKNGKSVSDDEESVTDSEEEKPPPVPKRVESLQTLDKALPPVLPRQKKKAPSIKQARTGKPPPAQNKELKNGANKSPKVASHDLIGISVLNEQALVIIDSFDDTETTEEQSCKTKCKSCGASCSKCCSVTLIITKNAIISAWSWFSEHVRELCHNVCG